MSELVYTISALKERNFGDHGDRCHESHVVVAGETVEALLRRVFPGLGDGKWVHHNPTDEIILRVAIGVDGKVTGVTEPEAQSDPWAAVPKPEPF